MNSKHISKSLTIQGAVVLALSWAFARFGVDVSEGELSQIADSLIALAGFAMIIVGRLKAKQDLHIKK